MLACDDSTSIDCARVMRGTASSAKARRPEAAMAAMLSASKGLSMPMSTVPGFIQPRCAAARARLGRYAYSHVASNELKNCLESNTVCAADNLLKPATIRPVAATPCAAPSVAKTHQALSLAPSYDAGASALPAACAFH